MLVGWMVGDQSTRLPFSKRRGPKTMPSFGRCVKGRKSANDPPSAADCSAPRAAEGSACKYDAWSNIRKLGWAHLHVVNRRPSVAFAKPISIVAHGMAR